MRTENSTATATGKSPLMSRLSGRLFRCLSRKSNKDGGTDPSSATAHLDKEKTRQYYFLYMEVVMSMHTIPKTKSWMPSLSERTAIFSRDDKSHPNANGNNQASANGNNQASANGNKQSIGNNQAGDLESVNDTEDKGISFQGMLTILARYKLVEDENCFSIKERLLHRQRMVRLHSLVNEKFGKRSDRAESGGYNVIQQQE
jgi:hypothetical protein